jgi:hypothetical protein
MRILGRKASTISRERIRRVEAARREDDAACDAISLLALLLVPSGRCRLKHAISLIAPFLSLPRIFSTS